VDVSPYATVPIARVHEGFPQLGLVLAELIRAVSCDLVVTRTAIDLAAPMAP
jgi:hypothetical protein